MSKSKSKVTSGSVFEHLGFSKEEQAALKLKAEIYDEVIQTIEKDGYSAKELEDILDVPQPRVSELLNGKISQMSIEKLVGYLQLLGKVPSKLKFRKASGF